MNAKSQSQPFDKILIFALVTIVVLGLIMVASASMVISDKAYGAPFHYFYHQSIYLALGIFLAYLCFRLPIFVWQQWGQVLLLLALGLLLAVLIPGIGRQVNGSMRWLGFAGIGGQVSELAKLFFILYLAGYIERRKDEVAHSLAGFIKPLCLLAIAGILLLAEPDFGAMVVLLTTAMGMLFLAGVRLRHYVVLALGCILIMGLLAVSAPYRLERLTSFLHPWLNQFGSGYQLTQSLIAFGRGGWFGTGLGESVQKLFYLPEAHTDFLFAVLGEELGLVGMLAVLILFSLLVWRIFVIAGVAERAKQYFQAYYCYGTGLWIGLQAMINMGVNMGILPTKGLTLPFMSYGGSSLLIMCIALSIILRIDVDLRRQQLM